MDKIEERNRAQRLKYANDLEYRELKKLRAHLKYHDGKNPTKIIKNKLGDFPRGKSEIGYIYIIVNPAYPQHIKVGRSLNLGMRLSTYNTGSPYRDYTYAFVQECADAKTIEDHFNAKYESSNEWYQISVEDGIKEIQNYTL